MLMSDRKQLLLTYTIFCIVMGSMWGTIAGIIMFIIGVALFTIGDHMAPDDEPQVRNDKIAAREEYHRKVDAVVGQCINKVSH